MHAAYAYRVYGILALVLARNCCLARMLPGEAENGVGMNRSVREGKKCEAL